MEFGPNWKRVSRVFSSRMQILKWFKWSIINWQKDLYWGRATYAKHSLTQTHPPLPPPPPPRVLPPPIAVASEFWLGHHLVFTLGGSCKLYSLLSHILWLLFMYNFYFSVELLLFALFSSEAFLIPIFSVWLQEVCGHLPLGFSI